MNRLLTLKQNIFIPMITRNTCETYFARWASEIVVNLL